MFFSKNEDRLKESPILERISNSGQSPDFMRVATWPKTFKEAFCERFNCPPEQFEPKAFWQCLYRHALPLAVLIYWIDSDVFREDFGFIREIGSVRDAEVFQVELDRFYGTNVRDKTWIRGTLSIRVSGKRLLRLKRRVIGL